MNIDDYQQQAMTTCLPSSRNLEYMVLGLSAEAGEVAGKLAKRIRGDDVSDAVIKAELGDCFWMLAGIATILGVSLSEVLQDNLDKLASRQARGALQGSGDLR